MISVIVISYNRMDYLEECLDSLSKQTFQDFEVILVTNFQFYADNYGFKCVKYIEMDGRIGEFLAEGIRISNGEVICFLDDDDLFAREKLYHVNRIFRNKRIAYLHNYSKLKKEGTLYSRLFLPPDFNMSSISIRKVIALNYLDVLNHIETGQDTFFYSMALCSGEAIKTTRRDLTIYRLHNKNTSLGLGTK